MNRRSLAAAAAACLGLAALAATPVGARTVPPPESRLGALMQVSIVDRSTGRELPVYRHRGEYWVAGTPGARYAIRVRNTQGERLMAVMSVDGVNVVTGETAGPSRAVEVSSRRWSTNWTDWPPVATRPPSNRYPSFETNRSTGTSGAFSIRNRPSDLLTPRDFADPSPDRKTWAPMTGLPDESTTRPATERVGTDLVSARSGTGALGSTTHRVNDGSHPGASAETRYS